MITVHKGELEYLCAPSISVPHCFTTRYGGVSEGVYASMNIGVNRGDDREKVLKNYAILADALGFDPHSFVLTRQTHTDIIRAVSRDDAGTGLYREPFSPCDGLITDTSGLALAVFTADCTPVLLFDPVTGAVGAVHAGWKGTAQDITGKAVEAMVSAYGCDPANIQAAIGPNIGQCCFETDWDVPQALLDIYADAIREHILEKNGKYYVDLKAVNSYALTRRGVRDIDISTHCTKCQPDRFWSARVHGQSRGSLGAIILCKGAQV